MITFGSLPRIFFLPLMVATFHLHPALATEVIPVMTYHSHPPFQVGSEKGLTWALAAYLTKMADGKYRFEARLLSRPAIDKALERDVVAVVPWVNPLWFKDRDEQRYLWAQHVLMNDGNAVVSRRDRPVNYAGPASMKGMVLGGLRGHRYVKIDDYIKDTGQIKRVNANNLTQNIRKLRQGRINVTLMPLAAAKYLIRTLQLEDELYISPTLQQEFSRRVLVSGKRQDIVDFLDRALTNPEWKESAGL